MIRINVAYPIVPMLPEEWIELMAAGNARSRRAAH